MMGEKIGETSGKVTGMRVLPGEGGRFVKMEMTIQTKGTLFGQKGTDMGTYVAYERIPGHGVIWSGFGVGTPTGKGMGMRWAAAVTYQTNSEKLARLNNVVGMVEHETDAQGNAKVRAWEWKAGK